MVSSLKKEDYKNLIKFLKGCCLKNSSLCIKYAVKMA